ncbi:uncharacterized protein LOC143275454 [Babylonia areolata]|uniref:uncharacterized protein LOC143275454 n=1 Tax=Babylonia areolata TaxID=304850 RepID=UPI003FCF23F6
MNLSLALPKDCIKFGAETDARETMTTSTGDTSEEMLAWRTTSEIKVSENSRCTATVLLYEIPKSEKFTAWIKMSIAEGGAPATIIHKKGGDTKWTVVINDLSHIFEEYARRDADVNIVRETAEGQFDGVSNVIFKTTGIKETVVLSDKLILSEERSLSPAPPTGDHPAGRGGEGGVGGEE